VDHRANSRQINQSMQGHPTLLQLADRTLVRSEGEGRQNRECGESDGDVRALENVLAEEREIEAEVEDQIGRKVKARIGETHQTEAAAVGRQPVPTAELPQWGNAQGQQQEAQAPITGLVGDLLDRVRPEFVAIETDRQAEQWQDPRTR